MDRLICLGTALAMTIGLAVVIPANVAAGGMGVSANGRTTVIAQEKSLKLKRGKQRPTAGQAIKPARHLRAVSALHAEPQESEPVVLGRVVAALDEALHHPSLSTGWHAALTCARDHLASVAEVPRRE